MENNELHYDIAIIGGGIVGTILGVALSDIGIKTCIIEKQDMEFRAKNLTDGRASAISSGSMHIIEKLGFAHLFRDYSSPINQIRVADGNSPLFLHFDNKLVHNKALGFMIENQRIINGLFDHAKEKNNLTLYSPDYYKDVELLDSYNKVTLASGKVIKCNLLIAADGKHSSLRTLAGIKVNGWNYDQHGIVLKLKHEFHHNYTAVERFLPAGPFAILPLKGGYDSAVVWTVKSGDEKIYLNLKEDELEYFLQNKFTDFLGKIKLNGKIFAYPLSVSYASTYYHKRMVLIGDSAHAIHPIAGQGLNLGIRDISKLVELIKHQYEMGLDVGSSSILEKYMQVRRYDNIMMLTATDKLNKLFSNDSRLLTTARRIGLAAVNKIPTLKKRFMKYAMG